MSPIVLQMSKEMHVSRLFSVFRRYGYDGATLTKIAEATGLGKASLYHHFPGGKEEMVTAVLTYTDSWLQDNILQSLRGPGSPIDRLQAMGDRISELYDGGNQPCLLAILQVGSGRDAFHSQVKATLERWIDAIVAILVEAGLPPTVARGRGEDAIILIQGALVASQGLDDPSLFQRIVQALPQTLMEQGKPQSQGTMLPR